MAKKVFLSLVFLLSFTLFLSAEVMLLANIRGKLTRRKE